MPREQILDAIILKKQDFGETDQIVTIFTKQEGKLRCLVKAAKLPSSKLQPALQPLLRSRVTLAGFSGLPKAIRAQPVKMYSGILASEDKIKAFFVVAEFLIRALPDGAPNTRLYNEVLKYLEFLNSPGSAMETNSKNIALGLAQFQMKAIDAVGFGIRFIPNTPDSAWFSTDRGGFFGEEPGADSVPVSLETYELFESLANGAYELSILAVDTEKNVPSLINRFVAYQLEREIKSSAFLR